MRNCRLLLLLFSLVLLGSPILLAQTNYYQQQEVELTIARGQLKGTLFTPSGIKRPPVVLIIAGSGPTDRDGNSPLLPGKNNSLLQLADSLAAHGIASLRYDKRGIAKSRMVNLKEEDMLFSDGVDDAKAWIGWLKEKGYRSVFVAGHSEGSLIALAAAQTEKVQGLISIAGAGRGIDQVLREQINGGAGPDSLKQLAGRYLDTLLRGQRIAKPNPLLFSLFRPSVQPYMISWLRYDPQQLIRNIACPTLIVQGTKDMQVTIADAKWLHQANPQAKLLLVDNMNHVLKEIQSDQQADNRASYGNPSLPIMTQLISGISDFVKTRYRRKQR